VKDIVVRAPELHAKARGRRAPIALYLQALGPRALLPMLELVLGGAPSDVKPEAFEAARLGLVEAIGLLRDPRALPVLGKTLDGAADYATARTAAEAIARQESDEAAARVTSALAGASGERARGILAGMGSCHRETVAKALADRLAGTAADDATALAAIRSLGDVGSAWAWQTLASRGDAAARVREIAARALVAAFVRASGDVRQEASNALMVVDDSHTPALVAAARASADAPTAAALDDLARRFANNPTRPR
jgi:hypothetical protein